MEAKELRIGNYVKTTISRDRGKPIEVDGTARGYVLSNGFHYKEIDIKPIPLTEEWLLRFGFIEKKCFNGSDYLKFNFCIWKFKGGYFNYYITCRGDDNPSNEVDIDIKYVHELQNLYFELNKEELTLNK